MPVVLMLCDLPQLRPVRFCAGNPTVSIRAYEARDIMILVVLLAERQVTGGFSPLTRALTVSVCGGHVRD